jgi:DNA-binding LytR/AlgR family response regulator
MEVLIIEDEAPAFRRLQKLLEDTGEDIHILDVIDSVKDSVNWLKNHHTPDLIFSDIQLADGISFEIFDQYEVDCPVVFTTAFDEYTLKAFEVNSIDYLLKPIKAEELSRSLSKFKKLNKKETVLPADQINQLLKLFQEPGTDYKERFLVKLGDRLVSVREKDIAYFYIQDGLVFLLTGESKKYPLEQTLDELEKVLNPRHFFRLNRQIIARIEAVKTAHQYFNGKLKIDLIPSWNAEVVISREKASAFKSWMDGQSFPTIK